MEGSNDQHETWLSYSRSIAFPPCCIYTDGNSHWLPRWSSSQLHQSADLCYRSRMRPFQFFGVSLLYVLVVNSLMLMITGVVDGSYRCEPRQPATTTARPVRPGPGHTLMELPFFKASRTRRGLTFTKRAILGAVFLSVCLQTVSCDGHDDDRPFYRLVSMSSCLFIFGIANVPGS